MSLTTVQAIPYLFLTFLLLIIFSIFITIFGHIFYSFIENTTKRKWNVNFFQKLLLSFGIGISIYIPICYIIAILKFLNFFTISLPIILIDVYYIINFLIREGFFIKRYYDLLKDKILKLNKDKLIFFSILIFVLYMSFIFYWKIIIHHKYLIGIDPIDNVGKFSKGLEYAYLPFDYTIIYPQGFRILCVACLSLLISPDIKTIIFFFKFAPLFYISLYIIVLAIILKNIFKKNTIVLIGLLSVLSTNYFHYRSIRFLPSNIASLLLIISIIIFISDCPNYILGFFISSIYMINPIVAFFYILSLTIFFFMKLILFNEELQDLLIEIIKIILLSIGLILPFILYLYSINYTIFDLIEVYNTFFGIRLQLIDHEFLINLNQATLSEEQIDFLTNWVSEEDRPWLKKQYKDNTIIFSYYFIFAIFGLFLKDNKNKDVTLLGKNIVIIILLFLILPVFLPNDNFVIPIPFWIKLRMLEFFCAPIIFMECYAIDYILEHVRYYTFYLNKKINFYKKLINRNEIFKFLKIENILIILLLTSSFSSYYYIRQEHENPWGIYQYSEEQIETILYIIENLPKYSKILVSEYLDEPSRNQIYELLYDYRCYLWDFTIKDCYNKTKKYCHENDIDYILIDLSTIDQNQLIFFNINKNNYEEVYENNRNIILKTRNDLGEVQDFGIYQSTWNFIDEKIGDRGYDISFINYYGYKDLCYASIEKSIGNHMNILDLFSYGQKRYATVINNLGTYEKSFNGLTSGTIEFWWRTTDINQSSCLNLIGDSSDIVVEIRINESQLQFYNGLSWQIIKSNILQNSWYHIRIDFECTNESYNELGQRKFDFYINNILELNDINFLEITTKIYKIKFKIQNNNDGSSFHTYLDAFGYSWDSNYNVGDNRQKIYL